MSEPRPQLIELAFAAVSHASGAQEASGPEADFLAAHARRVPLPGLADKLSQALRKPVRHDAALARLAVDWHLTAAEVLSTALAAAVEQDLMAGRVVAFAQTPVGGSRPTLGLLAAAFGRLSEKPLTPAHLAGGAAAQSGLFSILHDQAPLPERPIAVPIALCLALAGDDAPWPGGTLLTPESTPAPLVGSLGEQVAHQARALRESPAPVLAIRSAFPEEAHAVAAAVAAQLKRRAFLTDASPAPGLAVWLKLRECLPVFALDPAPGESRSIPPLPFHLGPTLAVAGIDGSIDAPGREVVNWILPVPDAAERARLWRRIIEDEPTAEALARSHRLSAARIVQLGRLANHQAHLDRQPKVTIEIIRQVSRTGEGSGLESLAEALPEPVPDNALVLTPETRAELESLLARCRHRDGLIAGLGPAAAARYTPGVRALFVGPSGTGKTLAACWLATHLGLPLFRVDLASITSKYIGETEKNLARLLARAERTEAVLLFDEADSLFGKRTDVRDANDRFANAQTNYLLQRIESFNGITLLTSNSRARFDTAFARRLEVIIEFPLPGPVERRALWLAHLGTGHALSTQELNRLAGQCDFPGGQIRNAVLAAAVDAQAAAQPL
ncbi:MAG: ATP-binding protein, partial [Limisphaerales bacterium]